MTTNILMTVGLGEGSTIVMGIVADGQVVCNIVLNKQQIQDHIRVLQRHCDALPDAGLVSLVQHATMN